MLNSQPVRSSHSTVRRVVRCGLIAALYTALCLAMAPLSFGPVQVRFAEALCLLPVFGTEYIVAVTLGCFLSNLLGLSLGTTIAADVLFGTAATLMACLVTRFLRGVRIRGLAIPASIPPVLFNAVIIGLEISFLFTDGAVTGPVIALNMLTVGLGEVISCCILGVALVHLIEHNSRLSRLFMEG